VVFRNIGVPKANENSTLQGKGAVPLIYWASQAHTSAAANKVIKINDKVRIIDVVVKKVAGGSASTVSPTVALQTSTGGVIAAGISIAIAAGQIGRTTNINSTGRAIVAAGSTIRLRKAAVGTTGPTASQSHAYEAYIYAIKSS
jgi:hypothetical protein